jgi:hypothetical protein
MSGLCEGVEKDPAVGWGPGVKEVVVGGWSLRVRAWVPVVLSMLAVIDNEVRDLAGNVCARVGVLGSDHPHYAYTFKFSHWSQLRRLRCSTVMQNITRSILMLSYTHMQSCALAYKTTTLLIYSTLRRARVARARGICFSCGHRSPSQSFFAADRPHSPVG